MFKKVILLCLTLCLLFTCIAPVAANEPPSLFTAHSVDELILWIQTAEAEPSEEWGSWYPFLSAARRFDNLLTVQSSSEEYTLKEILVQSNQDNMDYFFKKGNERFEILIELPGPEENPKSSLDDKMGQVNRELAAAYEGWQYTKSSAVVNGTETAIFYCDGGNYAKKDSEQTERVAPTAFFELEGHMVMICGIDGLYGSKWNNAWLDLFTFSEIDLAQYKWSNPFADVAETDWFYGDVEFVSIRGLMTGTGRAAFEPKITLSRAMIVTILYRQAGEPNVRDLSNPFDDVPEGLWFSDAVKWAYANKVVNGTGATTFDPEEPIKRQDLATILFRCNNEIMRLDLPARKVYAGFVDDGLISEYAKAAVKTFYEAEIINGKSAEVFDPRGTATRAEAAAMLHRLLLQTAVVSPFIPEQEDPDVPDEPPTYYSTNSLDELIEWINTAASEPSDAWSSMDAFLSAARSLGRILTVQPVSKEYSLEQILVQSNREHTDYFFRKDNDRFEILIELPSTEEIPKPSLDERMAQVNSELAESYEGWQYAKSSAVVNGTETAIYYCDGGNYARKDTDQTEPVAPTAFFELEGHLVMIRGIGELYGNKWDNAYLDLFRFEVTDLT